MNRSWIYEFAENFNELRTKNGIQQYCIFINVIVLTFDREEENIIRN